MHRPDSRSARPSRGSLAGGAIRLCAIALLAFLACGSSAMAQWPWGGGGGGGGGFFGGGGGGWGGGGGGWGGGGGYRNDENAGFWLREREMMQHQRIQRRPTYVHTKPQIRRAVPAGNPAVADKPAIALPDKPPAEAAFVIDVFGDSLGALLAQGLQEAYADRPEITIVRKAKGDTGLVTSEFYDWPKAVHDLLASNEKVSMAIVMIGSNDRQAIRDGNNRHEPLSDKWKEIYGNRVEEIAKNFREKKIPLVWVGLPISKSERLASDYSEINEVVRERAAKQDAAFVDIWEAFGDSRGLYNAFGPDVNGVIVKLRAMDGVHFTKPGARKLAHFVEGEVKRQFDLFKPKTEPGVANLEGLPAPLAPAEPGAAPAAPASPAPNGQQAALPAQPLVPAPPPKPASGPILPLTTPPIAPGGDLARRARTRDSSGDAQALVDQAIARGQPLEPKPNRADDFTWPRPAQ